MPMKQFIIGDDETVLLPVKKEVCSRCRGEGKHVNPNIDGNGITADEMEELGDEFRENYMSGLYDVPCEECKGERVVDVVDRAECKRLKLTQELKAYGLSKAKSDAEDAEDRNTLYWETGGQAGSRY